MNVMKEFGFPSMAVMKTGETHFSSYHRNKKKKMLHQKHKTYRYALATTEKLN